MPLQELGDRYWETFLRIHPLAATLYGYRHHDAELPPPSVEFEDETLAEMRDIIRQAEKLDPETLDTQDRISRAMLIDEAGKYVLEVGQRLAEMNVGALTGPHTELLQAAAQTTVSGERQAADILERYAKVPAFLGVYANRHRIGARRDRVPTATNVKHVITQIEAYLSTPLETDPFGNTAVLETWPGEAEWRVELRSLVDEKIRPAYARYRDVLRDEILPAARADDRPGITYVPGGDDLYTGLIHLFTTLDLTGEEVHRIGMEQVERLWSEFGEIGEEAFGVSDPAEVITRLREDPALKFSSAVEIVTMAEAAIARAEAAVPDWFNTYPKAECVVKEVPADLAPSMPPAYYMPPAEDGTRPGTYFVNTHEPTRRHRYESEAITFHEAVPGHHFDRTISQELKGVPTFRRYALAYAHAEGWGLYVERLTDEMGLYSSPVTRLGMVSADMWRACRLVVDSGIHALGWTRQQAIDFIAEKAPLAPEVIAQEVDRYIALPGQALAYMIGKLHIVRLRHKAEEALGDAFDIKRFHDVLLVHGALTLPVMEEMVDEWIAAGG